LVVCLLVRTTQLTKGRLGQTALRLFFIVYLLIETDLYRTAGRTELDLRSVDVRQPSEGPSVLRVLVPFAVESFRHTVTETKNLIVVSGDLGEC